MVNNRIYQLERWRRQNVYSGKYGVCVVGELGRESIVHRYG